MATFSPDPAPVLLHGFTGSSASWGAPVLDGLASAGLAPVLFDMPGHGAHRDERRASAYALEAVHRRLDGLLGVAADAGAGRRADRAGPGGREAAAAAPGRREEAGPAGSIAPGEPASPSGPGRRPPGAAPLVGYSMGGRLALSWAVSRPERVSRLVLESTSPGLAGAAERARRREADEALARRIEADGMLPFVDAWEALPLFETRAALPERMRREQRAIRLANRPVGLALALRHLGTGALPSYWDRLEGLDVPVLLLAGELDRKFVDIARDMARRLPRAELVEVPGAGHTVHLERPGAWLEAVVPFLRA